MAKPYKRKDSRFWWIAPSICGVQVPQSSGSTDYEEAWRRLRILEGNAAGNATITPKTDRGSFAALLELVETDYAIKARHSAPDVGRRITKHIDPILGSYPAGKVTSGVIAEYIQRRQDEEASNASINRELAVVKRAFRLGVWNGDVSTIPRIEMLPEDNARQGFFNEAAFRSVLKFANESLRPVLVVAYYTGWRIQSILDLEWRQVDFAENVVGLHSQQTKNRTATTFPLAPYPELLSTLKGLETETRRIEKRDAVRIPFVFHRNGGQIRSIRTAWILARAKAGLPGRLIHDFRRTAVRNLKRDGWSDTDIMRMVGLKTLSIFHRYNVTTAEDILEKGNALPARVIRQT